MKKNNTTFFKLSILFLIIFCSRSAYSGDYFNNSIATPEIIKRTQKAFDMCREFGVYPASPENDVYWSESPETDKRYEKSLNIDYLWKIEAEAKQAKLNYFQQQRKSQLYRKNLEYPRQLKVSQRKNEIKYHAYLREQRRMKEAHTLPQDSPDSDIVVWKDDSPPSYTAGSFMTLQDHKAAPTRALAEEDLTSHEASSKDSIHSTISSHTLSLSQIFTAEFFTDNKENIDNQTPPISQSKSKRLREQTIASQKSTHQLTATYISEKSDFGEKTAPTQLFVYENANLTQKYSNTNSPLRKKSVTKETRSPFSPLY